MERPSSQPAIAAQQDYYNDYWAQHPQRLNAHEVLRLAEILDAIAMILPEFKGRELRICDLGCGRGWLSNELLKFGQVTGVDLSSVAVSAASARWPAANFEAADILDWRPDKCFDLVVSSEVLEHVPDQQRFAATVRHLLRDGGFLVLTTPNGFVKPAWDSADMGQQLIEKWVTRSQLRKLFAQFSVLRHRVFLMDFAYTGLFRFSSAPKLHALLRGLRLLPLYDLVRQGFGLGLYQILVARINKAP